MNLRQLDQFGEILISRVRDKSIKEWDMIIDGRMKGVSSDRIRNTLSCYNKTQIEALGVIMPQIVDTVLHHLLWTIEQSNIINLNIVDENGAACNIREASDGLSGELYSEDGWINRFSQERNYEI